MSGPWEKYAQPEQTGPWSKYGTPAKPETSFIEDVTQGAGNLAAGLVRGAGSIGATITENLRSIGADVRSVTPANMRPENGFENLPRGADIRSGMDAGLQSMGAQPDSLMYKGGKLTGEIAGTAGAGGAIANGARIAGAAPALTNAIASGGLSGGGNMLTRIFGGGVGGAAMAGLVDPSQATSGAAIGAALPGVVKVAGVAGNALSELVSGGAKRLMQSAIKPTIAQLRTGDSATAVNTLLEYGINPTAAGVNKLKDLIGDLNNQIGQSIGASTATVSKQKVLNSLNDVRTKFGNQVSPTGDLNAIKGVADDFAANPTLPLGDAIPVQQAQAMKQGTYKVLAKKYGQLGSAETEAQKGLARGLKEEVATAVPGVQALNAEESRLITTLGVAERRALMELNKNPTGLASLASNPVSFAMFMADRSAAFKSVAARMINSVNPVAGAAGNKMLGAASNPLLRAGATEANP